MDEKFYKFERLKIQKVINSFHDTGLYLYSLKASENVNLLILLEGI